VSDARTSVVVGAQQSPIDIDLAEAVFVPGLTRMLEVDYANKTAVGTFEGDNFVIQNGAELRLRFRGMTYELLKLHFHARCEHLVGGSPLAECELHLVHRVWNPDGSGTDKLVLALFFDRRPGGRANESFRRWAGGSSAERVSVPLKDFAPADSSRWITYQGSLTGYPFTEDVTWVVNMAHETVNAADVDALLRHHAGHAARPVQPLNRRIVLRNFA
jgi:carbonic anhydrase